MRTAAAEKQLSELQKQVTDLEQKAVRTQALIEQTIARRGRAEQNLSNAEAAKPPAKPGPCSRRGQGARFDEGREARQGRSKK